MLRGKNLRDAGTVGLVVGDLARSWIQPLLLIEMFGHNLKHQGCTKCEFQCCDVFLFFLIYAASVPSTTCLILQIVTYTNHENSYAEPPFPAAVLVPTSAEPFNPCSPGWLLGAQKTTNSGYSRPDREAPNKLGSFEQQRNGRLYHMERPSKNLTVHGLRFTPKTQRNFTKLGQVSGNGGISIPPWLRPCVRHAAN